jgi:hypothetical protein
MNMRLHKFIYQVVFTLLFAVGCETKPTAEVEKVAIIKTLNNETKFFFTRDYANWKDQWVQESFVSKTYMWMTDSTLAETIGWADIDSFGKNFIQQHPIPEPVPVLLNDVNVRLYQDGAWVTFEQQDSIRGLKRETRLMEKRDGEWKIAGMHTTIYGFQ